MSKTYTSLAQAHHDLYGSFSDYDLEFRQYERILRRWRCKRVLELGCGSGNLARRFVDGGYDYVGLDLSRPFISMARKLVPRAKLVRGDMRSFTLRPRFDAVLITGRTFTHMTNNTDALAALRCVRSALRPGGMLVFDNFDAGTIFTNKRRHFVTKASVGDRHYTRVGVNTMLPERGWIWRWSTVWTIKTKERKRAIRDQCLLRAFTPDEIRLLLGLSGFEHVRTSKRGACLLTIARR